MAGEIPYLNLSGLLSILTLTPALQANFAALDAALTGRMFSRVVRVQGYSATGATTSQLQLPVVSGRTPQAVILVRAQLKTDPAGDLTIVPRYNFSATASAIWAYEPGGLVTNSTYDLTYVIMET